MVITAIMELYHRLLKDRRNDALERAKIVHEELLKEIRRLIEHVEKVSDPYLVIIGKLRQELYLDLLLSSKTKKEMKKLKELAERYRMMGHITERLVTQTIEESVDDYLKNTNKKMDGDLKNIFTSRRYTSIFINLVVINKEDIDTRWFEKKDPNFSKRINDNIESEDSLINFFKDLDQKIKSEYAIVFLKKERRKLLSQAEKIKVMLEKEKKKLTSFYSFWYGSGDKIKIDNLKKKENENNRPKYL